MSGTMSPLTLQMLLASGGAGVPQDPAIAASVPRLQLAQSMMQQGMNDAPTTKFGALGRLGQAILGNVMFNKANEGLQDILTQRAQQAGQASDWIMGGQQNAPGTTPAAPTTAAAPISTFATQLASAESSGNPAATEKHGLGYSGLYQFGTDRLASSGLYTPAPGEDLKTNQWKGTLNIPGYPNVKTQADFLASPAAQNAALNVDLENTDKAIANTPGAGAFDQNGLRAVAHLGGVEGMRRFVQSNGAYSPDDLNHTHLMDYYQKFSGSSGGAQQGVPSVSSPAPGVAPSGPNPWEVQRRALSVLTNPAMMYNQQAQQMAQRALEQARFQIQLGSWSTRPDGTQINAYTGEVRSAATKAEHYVTGEGGVQTETNTGKQIGAAKPLPHFVPMDPNNPTGPYVDTTGTEAPKYPPSPRIGQTPAGDVLTAGPTGVNIVVPANNPGVAARAAAGSQGAETGKNAAVIPQTMIKLGSEADNAIGNIDYGMNQLHQAAAGGINSGYFAPWLATAAAAGKSLGINIAALGVDPNAVGNVQSAQKTLGVVAGTILQNAIGKDSAITDAKIEHFIHTQPGIETDPQAIERVLGWARSQFVFNRNMAMDAMHNVDPNTGMIPPGWQAQFYKKAGAFAPIYDPLSQEMEQPKGQGPAAAMPTQQTNATPQQAAPTFSRDEAIAEARRRGLIK